MPTSLAVSAGEKLRITLSECGGKVVRWWAWSWLESDAEWLWIRPLRSGPGMAIFFSVALVISHCLNRPHCPNSISAVFDDEFANYRR